MTVRPFRSWSERISGCTKNSFMLLSPPITMTTSWRASSTIATELSTAECAISNSPLARPSRSSVEFVVKSGSTFRPRAANTPLSTPTYSGRFCEPGNTLTRTGLRSCATARPDASKPPAQTRIDSRRPADPETAPTRNIVTVAPPLLRPSLCNSRRRDPNPSRPERLAQRLGKPYRSRLVTVQAQRPRVDRDLFALLRAKLPLQHHPERLHHGGRLVGDHRAGPSAGRQRPAGLIRTVGEPLADGTHAERARGVHHRAAGERIKDHPVEISRCPGDRFRERRIARRHVVERAVDLEVMKARPRGARERRDRARLVQHEVVDLLRADLHRPPAKPLQVGERRMGADGNAVLHGQANALADRARVARVEPAGDVRRGDERHDPAVVAHPPRAVALAHVAVQINHLHRRTPRGCARPGPRPGCRAPLERRRLHPTSRPRTAPTRPADAARAAGRRPRSPRRS